jgi:aldose 1-epimerase
MNPQDLPAPSPLTLAADGLRLALRPDLGGCIAGLWLGEDPVLRSAAPELLTASRGSACYPLAPYSNRIGYAHFRWHGQDHRTVPNFDAEPHSVHGVAWQRAWRVLGCEASQAELEYVHAADAHWPFAFTLRQRFVLSPGALELHLSLRNDATLHAPAGLGWHPYFPRRQRSRLHAEVSHRWDSDAAGLPTRAVPQPGIDGDVAHMAFDHCFAGWRGAARLRDEKLSLRLSSSLPYLVVFTPQTRPYWCVEPVSHVSNALHMSDPAAHGLRTLAPGGSMDAWMRLEVDRA